MIEHEAWCMISGDFGKARYCGKTYGSPAFAVMMGFEYVAFVDVFVPTFDISNWVGDLVSPGSKDCAKTFVAYDKRSHGIDSSILRLVAGVFSISLFCLYQRRDMNELAGINGLDRIFIREDHYCGSLSSAATWQDECGIGNESPARARKHWPEMGRYGAFGQRVQL